MNAFHTTVCPLLSHAWKRVASVCLIACIGFSSASSTMAQDRTELGERQRLVQRKMVELESSFTIIAERLQEKEPERAKRLIATYQQAKELLITKKMLEVGELLDQNKLVEADQAIDEVMKNLEILLRQLMNNKEKKISKQEEIEQLEKWKQTIQKLKNEQNQQTRESNKLANKDKTLNKLDGQIKKLENLIGRQKEVAQKTSESKGAGLRALDKVADEQFEIRKETEDLAEEIAEDSTADLNKPGDQKPGDQKPGDSKPGDSKPGDSKPGDSKPGDSKPQDQNKPPQPGQKSLEKAAKHQQKAEEKLGSGKSEDAKRQEDQAIAELEKAKKELKKERDRIASLPPEAFDEMAEKQRRTRDKSLDVAEEMAKAPKPKADEQDGDPNANQQQQQKQPGQEQMKDASESMKKAAKNLDNQDPQKAERQQKEAEKKLDEALKEIEERLEQLREETREEKLARLEARFREMLERQQVASVMTVELDDKKLNLGRLIRRDQLMMLRLGSEESEISELGQQAYDLLLEDGTSIVFPEIVQGMREDLATVSKLLQDEKTGQLTQLIQKEIESTLEELLEALAQTKKNSKGGGGGGGGGGGEQPLLQRSAELKIMKAQQRRIHRRTKGVDRILEGENDLETEEDLQKELQDIADRQRELQEMAERIMENDG